MAAYNSAAAIAPLLAALKDEDRDVRIAAANGLAQASKRDPKQLGPALEPLLHHADEVLRHIAIENLRQCGAAAVPQVTALLKDKDSQIRARACAILRNFHVKGDQAREAVPALVEMAKDVETRGLATVTLHTIIAGKSLEILLEALEADKALAPAMRRARQAGKDPAKLLGALLRDLQDADLGVSRDAAIALEEVMLILPNHHARVLPKLDIVPAIKSTLARATKELTTGAPGERRQAAALLAALRMLVAATEQKIAIASARIDDPKTYELRQAIDDALQRARDDSDAQVRRHAKRALRTNPLRGEPYSEE